MLTREIMGMILQFMQRVELKGAEVEAYVTVINQLQAAMKEDINDGPDSTDA
jgi:hypothetical protein